MKSEKKMGRLMSYKSDTSEHAFGSVPMPRLTGSDKHGSIPIPEYGYAGYENVEDNPASIAYKIRYWVDGHTAYQKMAHMAA